MEPKSPQSLPKDFDFRESISNTRAKLLQAALNSMDWKGNNANILVVGLTGAGKSTFLEFLDRGAIIEKTRKPTLSFSRLLIDFGKFKMVFIDAPGQRAYWNDWLKYLSGAHGIIFLVDSANFKHVKIVNSLVYDLLKLDTYSKPVIFLANKQDLQSSIPAETIDRLLGLSQGLPKARIFEISAMYGNGILPSLKWFLSALNGTPRRAAE